MTNKDLLPIETSEGARPSAAISDRPQAGIEPDGWHAKVRATAWRDDAIQLGVAPKTPSAKFFSASRVVKLSVSWSDQPPVKPVPVVSVNPMQEATSRHQRNESDQRVCGGPRRSWLVRQVAGVQRARPAEFGLRMKFPKEA